MRKVVMGKVKRTVSILLTAAMIITMIPQTAMPVYAEEVEQDVDAGGGGEDPEADDVTPEEMDNDIPAVVSDESGDDDGTISVALNVVVNGTWEDEYDEETSHFTHNISATHSKTGDETREYEDYSFTVKPAAGYAIANVNYYIGEFNLGSTAYGLSEKNVEGGKEYTIPKSVFSEEMNGQTMITICVSVLSLCTVTVKYNNSGIETAKYAIDLADNDGFSDSGNDQIKDIRPGDISVLYNQSLKLQVVPAPDTNYEAIVKVDGKEQSPEKDTDIYTIDSVQKDMTIDISAERTSYNVLFKAVKSGEGGEDVANVVVTWQNVDAAEGKGTILNGRDLMFTLSGLDEGQKIAGVKYGRSMEAATEDVTLDETGYYIVKADDIKKLDSDDIAIRAEITISTETEPEEPQYYRLELVIDGEKDSASVTFAMPPKDGEGQGTEEDADQEDGGVTGKKLDGSNSVLVTRNRKLRLTISVEEGYELAEVDPVVISAAGDGVGKWQIVGGNANQYDLVFGESKAAVLRVSTRGVALTSPRTVEFVKDGADHLEYKVTLANGLITKAEGAENKYNLAVNARTLDFTITADGSYRPVVTYGSNTEAKFIGTPVRGTDGRTTYNYSLIANKLADKETITIKEESVKEEPADHTVTIIYDKDEVNVNAKNGTATETPDEAWDDDSAPGYTTDVPEGTVLSFTLTALDNCTITRIETSKGGADKASLTGFPVKGSTYHNFQITADDDIVIEVTTDGAYIAKPLEEKTGDGFKPVTPNNKGVYSVHYDGTCKAAVTKGASVDPAEISGFKVMEGSSEVQGTQENYTVKDFIPGKSTDVTITFTEKMAGRNLTLQLFCEGRNDTPVASYSLSVYKEILGKDVKVNGNKAIEQAADTFKTYTLTVTGGADVNSVKVEKVGTDDKDVIKHVEIRNGKLELTTGYGVGESTELLFYTGDGANKKYIFKSDGTPLSINVKATPLLDPEKTAAPAVKLASTTDVSLKLSLGSNKGIETSATDNVYYEIQVIPDKGADSSKIKDQPQTLYRRRTGNAQEETVYVGSQGSLTKPSYGTGAQWNFTVKVRLVHVMTKNALVDNREIGDDLVSATQLAADLPCSTKEPLYETNLKLTKKTTTIYTGQTVLAAIPQYSKDAAVIALSDARDITVGVPEDQRLTADPESLAKDEVKLEATPETAPGRHTIEVIAEGTDKDTMYASRATIDVTVVRGIEKLELDIPSTSLYKGDKAASLKATVIYNDGAADQVPRARKVEWYLVNKDTEQEEIAAKIAGDESVDAIKAAAPEVTKDSLVSIDKNGKVNVNKNYIVKANPDGNTFKILVKAADFGDNWTVALSKEITITRDRVEIAQAAIIGKVADKNGEKQDTVLASDAKTNPKWPATTINGSRLVAFAPGKASYNADDVDAYGHKENITYTSSNKKAVEINEKGEITVIAPANNVTLTAAAADGSDSKLNKQSVKVSVDYDQTGELGLQIEKYNQYHVEETFNIPTDKWKPEELEAANRTITFNDSSAATFKLTVMQQVKDEGSSTTEVTKMKWAETEAFTNYKVTVSGGRILQKETGDDPDSDYNDGADVVRIVATAKETKVRLTDNAEKVTREYTLKNEGLANAATKAPKVTLSEKGTIDATRYADKSLTVTIAANGRNYPLADALAYGGLYAKVDIDWSAMTAKNQAALKELSDAITYPAGYIKLDPGSEFNLTFAKGTLPAGSYKFKVSVGNIGNVSGGNDFILAAQPAAVTLKVEKNKTPSFKPTTSYKLSAKDNGYVELTGKGTYTGYKFIGLFNSNISKDEKNKDIKGAENNFTAYFEMDKQNPNILRLTDECFENGELITIPPGDLTGYVSYEAWYGWYGGEEVPEDYGYTKLTGTVKIAITMTDLNKKYAISNASADSKEGGVANVSITADKNNGYVRYAMAFDQEGRESSEWSVVNPKGVSGIEIGNDKEGDYVIRLKHNNPLTDPKQKSQKVTVRIIPSDSYYADMIKNVNISGDSDGSKTIAARKDIIKKYGIPLTTTITMIHMSTATGRIRINANDLKQTFSGEFSNSNKGFAYDKDGNGYYYVNVPITESYDKVIAEQISYNKISITKISDQSIEVDSANRGIIFEAISGMGEGGSDGPYIKISLKKSYLAGRVNKLYTYDSKTKAYIPKTLSVTVEVPYVNSTVRDTFTFSLTMPGRPAVMTGTTESDFAAAVAAIKDQAQQPLTPGVGIKGKVDWHIHYEMNDYLDAKWKWADNYNGKNAGEADKNTIIQEDVAEYLVQNAIREYIDDDSGINFDKTTYEVSTTQNRGDKSQPGKFEVTVIFAKGSEAETTKKDDNSNSAAFGFTIQAAGTAISDITPTVNSLLEGYALDTGITDEAEQKTLINQYLRNGLEADGYGYNLSNIRFIIDIKDWKGATETSTGSFGVEVTIYNALTGEKPEEPIKQTVTIPKLRTGADIKAAVEKKLGLDGKGGVASGGDVVITDLTKSNNKELVKIAVRDAALSVIHEKEDFGVKYVTIGEADDFTYEPAGADRMGRLSFTLALTDKSGKNEIPDKDGKPYEITLTAPSDGNVAAKPHYMDPENAAKRVEKWIEANIVAAADYDESGSLKAEKADKVLKNGVTAADIINAIQPEQNPDVDNNMVVWNDSNIKVSFQDGTFQRKDARVNDDGSVKGTIVLTDKYVSENFETVKLEVVIPVLPQTPAQAKTAVLTAIEELADGELRVADISDDTGNNFLKLVRGKLGTGKDCRIKADYDIVWDSEASFKLIDLTDDKKTKYVSGTINIVYAKQVGGNTAGTPTGKSIKMGKTAGVDGVEVTVTAIITSFGLNPDAKDDTDRGPMPDDEVNRGPDSDARDDTDRGPLPDDYWGT